MDKIFLTVLNMSLIGSYAIAVICAARLPLKKAPKIVSYCLWAAAGFRLLFPFSIESAFSLIPIKTQTIPPDIVTQSVPRIDSGMAGIDNMVSGVLPGAAPQSGVYPLRALASAGACLWLVGVAAMLAYGAFSYLTIRRRLAKPMPKLGAPGMYGQPKPMPELGAHGLSNANSGCPGLIETGNIQSPFIFGVAPPKIYIPAGLAPKEREYVILHEQTHIRRHDHIIKFAAYIILCLHWFNPLAWAAFLLMGVDMEMSCDECVLKRLGGGIKKDYSMSLLSLAAERLSPSGGAAFNGRPVGSSPLAFGENGVKNRIKNVLSFKKAPKIAAVPAAALVTALVLGLVLSRTGVNAVKTEGASAIASENGGMPAEQNVSEGGGMPEPDVSENGGIPEPDASENGGSGEPQALEIGGIPERQVPEGGGVDVRLQQAPAPEDSMGDRAAMAGTAAITDTAKKPDIPDMGGKEGMANMPAARVYTITDYYDEGGRLSELGQSLRETNSEKALTVSGGDIILVGGRRYEVAAESLTLPFYTQPSLEKVSQWWTDCLDNLAESGKLLGEGVRH